MKKDSSSGWKFVFTTVLIVFIQTQNLSQNKTVNVQKTSSKEITVSITGIEYDDVDFIKLRETLKQNMKVKEVNPGYSGGTAKLSVQYSGKATDLWDELPQTVKKLFQITTIDITNIKLQKTQQKQTETSKTTSTTTKKEEYCINCIYYKSCNYDTSVNFDGVQYVGVKSGQSKGYYYYCNNGSLLRKYLAADKKYYTQTLLKSNEPLGTSWAYTIENGDTYRHTTVAKGISIKVSGTLYSDVMIVHNNYITVFRNDYYAKDYALIKSDTLDKKFDPLKMASMKGLVDQSISGLWKHHNNMIDMDLYYKFNGDGTCEYYAGSVNSVNQMPKGKSFWRLNGENLELYNGEWDKVVKILIQKKNDATSGKPTLVIQYGYSPTETRTYFSEDGKTVWK